MYDFDREIDRLNTHSYKWDLLGEDYLPLWVADTDFAVPPAFTRRIAARNEHPIYGYFLTGDEIYNTITDWFRREYRAEIPGKSWIRIVPGIVPALAVASNIYGGKSITNIPNYSCLLTAPEKASNVMLRVPLANNEEEYSIDFDALEEAITDDTRVFYLCNPHNPIGKVYKREELLELSHFARKHNLLVVSDEAHCEVVYEGEHIPFFTVDDYARDNSICLYSNGKMYNVPDLIFAFAVIPNPAIREEFERLGYALGEEHVLNVEGGIATYGESKDWQVLMLSYLKANRDYLESELRRRFPKARLPHLQATYLQWVDFTPYGDNVNADFFKKEAHVFLTDGAEFGNPDYVRINFGTRRAVLEEALDRMEDAIAKLV